YTFEADRDLGDEDRIVLRQLLARLDPTIGRNSKHLVLCDGISNSAHGAIADAQPACNHLSVPWSLLDALIFLPIEKPWIVCAFENVANQDLVVFIVQGEIDLGFRLIHHPKAGDAGKSPKVVRTAIGIAALGPFHECRRGTAP